MAAEPGSRERGFLQWKGKGSRKGEGDRCDKSALRRRQRVWAESAGRKGGRSGRGGREGR